MAKKLLPEKTGDLSDWYTALIRLAELADYGPSKGSMIIRPYGYAIWEKIQESLDKEFKARGIKNAYFPVFIPMSFIQKEKDHVEGFAPELAVVTHGGGEELEESLAVRPTSETIMYDSYAKWVQSWRDLPILINQWCNVVRWEKRTMPFIRTSEFLWQEGHTAHETHDGAKEIQEWAMGVYAKIYREVFAIEGYVGFKSKAERFAGADSTLTFESLMPSGKTLQSCTSHDLGQNFAKSFDIKFQNRDSSESYVWQTSWGFSTRSMGGLIIGHGDDNGLILPPRLAPEQIVIIPVKQDKAILEYCKNIKDSIKGEIRTLLDDRDDASFGFKINKWEVKGVPVILKIGQREVENTEITYTTRYNSETQKVHFEDFCSDAGRVLSEIQNAMLEGSKKFQQENVREAKDYQEFKQLIKEHKGFIKVFWNDDPDVEKAIKEETKYKSSCMPIDWPESKGVDFYTGKPATRQWLFAQSY